MTLERESLGSRGARTFSVLTLGRVVALLIGIASIVIIARLLGPTAYGVYTIAYAFFALIGATNNFGYGSYLTKYLSEYGDSEDREKFTSVLAAGYLSVIVAGLLLSLFGFAISGFVAGALGYSGVTTTNLILASSILFFYMLYGTSDHALIGIGMNTTAAIMENSENVIFLVVSALLILLGKGVDGALTGILVSYVFASVFGTYKVFSFAHRGMRAKIGWPSTSEIKRALRFALPVAVNNFLSNAMINVATLFLGFSVVSALIGNFGIAKNARNVLAVFYGTAAVTLVPMLAIAIARGPKTSSGKKFEHVYNKTLLYSIISTVPIIAYIGTYSTPVVYLLVGRVFGSAPQYLSLVALGTIIGLAGTYVTSLFVARGRVKQLLTYSLASALAQLVALFLLVHTWGVLGAIASVFFVGSIATSYLFLRGARKILGVRTDYSKLARAFAANAVLAAVLAVTLLSQSFAVELVVGLIILIVAYPPLLVLFRSMDSEDMKIMSKSMERLPTLRVVMDPMMRYFAMLIAHLQ